MDKAAIKRILDSADGRALVQYLVHSVNSLDQVSNLPETLFTPEEVGNVVMARQEAIKVLNHILADFFIEQAPSPATPGEYLA